MTIPLGVGGDAASDLLSAILDHARQAGLDQRRLAAAAGISSEALSRLKKTGGCRLATALALARAAGLRTLQLDPSAGLVAAHVAARKLSAGRRLPISAEDLVAELASGAPSRRHRGHLCAFFEELPVESVHDVFLDHALEYPRLLALARDLGAEGETVDWLAEMASDGVAHAP